MRADEWIARPVVSLVLAQCVGIVVLVALASVAPRDMIRSTNIAVMQDGAAWRAVDMTDRSWGPEHAALKGRVFSIDVVEEWKKAGLVCAWRRDRIIAAGQVGPVEADEGLRREAIRRGAVAAGVPAEIAARVAMERVHVARVWRPIGVAVDAALVVLVLVFAFSLAWLPVWLGRRGEGPAGVCGWCGYQKGTAGVCPECGRAYGES